MKRIYVYVAGRYSADNVMEVLGNIRRGIEVSRELLMRGYAPFCPWMDFLYVLTADYREFAKMDKSLFQAASMEWVEACDAMLVISESDGVRREVERARALNIPVFFSVSDLCMTSW